MNKQKDLLEICENQFIIFKLVASGDLNAENVNDMLKRIIGGKGVPLPPSTKVPYDLWKRIAIGGHEPRNLCLQVKEGAVVEEGAYDVLRQEGFRTHPSTMVVGLIVLTPKDLGHTTSPTTETFFDPVHLADWSASNLKKGTVLKLCPAEVGPHLRKQYELQPKGETLWVAMEGVPNNTGCLNMFVLGRRSSGNGRSWIDVRHIDPGAYWSLDRKVVFLLSESS